jgi:pSer/pThr/pTyr-binding forkhead associated (FHA) protein
VATIDARIKILSGPSAGQMIPISNGESLVGRDEDCHLRPPSEFLSRRHGVLLLDEKTLRIRDLGSKNGTFVNGHRIGTDELILLHGDRVSMGDFDFHVILEPSTPRNPDLVSPGSQAALWGTGVFDGETIRVEAFRASSETPASMPADSTATRLNDSPPSEDVSAAGQRLADSSDSEPA